MLLLGVEAGDEDVVADVEQEEQAGAELGGAAAHQLVRGVVDAGPADGGVGAGTPGRVVVVGEEGGRSRAEGDVCE